MFRFLATFSMFLTVVLAASDVWKLPPAQAGSDYQQQIRVDNPDRLPLRFVLADGQLPPGIQLDPSGKLSGRPAASNDPAYEFLVRIEDQSGAVLATGRFSIQVLPARVKIVSQSEVLPPAVAATPADPIPAGEEARLVFGFEQAGASGAESTRRFFFDSYLNRPLPIGSASDTEPRTRWWGNVRVSSAPRQIDSPLTLRALSQSWKSLKVNELAQSAEFLTGLEFRIGEFATNPAASRQRFTLGVIGGGGATAQLTTGTVPQATIYEVPAPGSPDSARLGQAFPQAIGAQFVSFLPPSRDRFFLEYFAGFRLTTRYAGAATPAMVSATVGQNESVTGGTLNGAVGRVEAFYPLAIRQASGFSAIYLFGTAQFRLGGMRNLEPFALTPAVSSDPARTQYLTTPSTRDLYSIGIGLDLVRLLSR